MRNGVMYAFAVCFSVSLMNGRNEQTWLRNFTHGHAVAVDSRGNLYIAETDTSRRMQKFTLMK